MSDWKIEKILLSELRDFYKNAKFADCSVMPVSDLRVESYLSNPNARLDDIVLYYVLVDNEVVAFRTFYADMIKTKTETVRFAWCSGVWTHPKFRRKGLSGYLLKEAYADWDKRLMFTNYAPESERGNLKSGLFSTLVSRNGVRFYLKADYKSLLRTKTENVFGQIMAAFIAVILQLVSWLRMKSFRSVQFSDYKIDIQTSYHDGFFSDDERRRWVFERNSNVLRWIFEYPWIRIGSKTESNYPFSLHRNDFQYYFITISKHKELNAKMLLSKSEGKVKLLFAASDSDYDSKVLMSYLCDWCVRNEIQTLTVIDESWARYIRKGRNPFGWINRFSMHIYSTFRVENASDLNVNPWEGDYIFT